MWNMKRPLKALRKVASGTTKGDTSELFVVGTVAAVKAHDKDINCIACAPNDALAATASQDKTVKVCRQLMQVPSLGVRTDQNPLATCHSCGIQARCSSRVCCGAIAEVCGLQSSHLWIRSLRLQVVRTRNHSWCCSVCV